jgi:tryptophan-rich sensory protein
MKNILKLIASVVLSQAAGVIGSLFTVQNIPTWYSGLNKPSFNPPNYIFGPVWITLYFIIGIAFYLVWKKSNTQNIKIPVVLFISQLVLNVLWSILFFGLKNPELGFMEIIILWIFIVLCIIKFYPVSKISSWLMFPYLLWVSFASVLNFKIWMLN